MIPLCEEHAFLYYFSYKTLFVSVRILDNLPLVVPIERVDQGSPSVVYQLGYHIGLKGQYEGVSRFRLSILFRIHAEQLSNF